MSPRSLVAMRPRSLVAMRPRSVLAIATLCLACTSVTLLPAVARAQFAIDKTELFLRPDAAAQRSGVLMVRNEGIVRAQAVITIEDWDRDEDGTNRFFPAGAKAGSCAAALRVFPLSVSLAPGEAQAIRVDLEAGLASTITRECWSVVLVEATQPQTQANGRTLVYTLRTGLKVYAAPAGLRVDGEVSDLAVAPRTTDRGTDYEATVTFRNTGEKHVIARGRVELRRDDNSLVATVPLQAVYALPGAEMRVKALLPPLPRGRYVLLAILDFGGAELAAAQLEHEVR